ncbi:hypothetical protein EON77_03115, partial [bacterium]
MTMPRLGLSSLALTLVVLATTASALADQKLVRLTSFPSIALADGRSQISINVEVRDTGGRLVPDGTRVVLSTTLGYFRENIVTTSGGFARAQMTASGAAGIAKITASVLGDASSPTTLEFEFVADRKLLASAEETVDVYAGESLEYTYDTRVLDAKGAGQKARFRYRDLTIEADEFQYALQTGEVRAHNAKVKLGKSNATFTDFYIRLANRKGIGTGVIKTRRPDVLLPNGPSGFRFMQERTKTRAILLSDGVRGFVLQTETLNDGFEVPPLEERFGIVEITPAELRPGSNPTGSRTFEFEDLTESLSSITAKRATIFPRKLINFARADLRVAGQKVLSAPLYQLPLTATQSPIITEQIVNLNDNQIAVNYPYYLSLAPGSSSLLRFRMGQSYGRSTAVNRGAYLDYELNWNKGDDQIGGLHMTGLARNDWSLGARQFLRIDPRTTANAQVELPAGRSLFGSANASRAFDGYQATLSTSLNQSLRGPRLSTRDASFIVERDPIPVPGVPVNLFLGLTATDSTIENSFQARHQSTVGTRLRAQSNAIRLDQSSTLTTSLTVNRFLGDTTGYNTTVYATTTLGRQLGSGANLVATYDLAVDGFNDALLGRHRLSMQGNYNRGAANFSIFAARSLDLDRQSLYADGSYRLSRQWRVGYSYTLDQYLGSSFRDYNVFLGFG